MGVIWRRMLSAMFIQGPVGEPAKTTSIATSGRRSHEQGLACQTPGAPPGSRRPARCNESASVLRGLGGALLRDVRAHRAPLGGFRPPQGLLGRVHLAL